MSYLILQFRKKNVTLKDNVQITDKAHLKCETGFVSNLRADCSLFLTNN